MRRWGILLLALLTGCDLPSSMDGDRQGPMPLLSAEKSPATQAPSVKPASGESVCTRVQKGDVLVVEKRGEPTVVRLQGVEVPAMPPYEKAAAAISENAVRYCAGLVLNREVRLEKEDRLSGPGDAQVSAMVYRYSDGRLLNKQLIDEGLAFVDLKTPFDPALMEQFRKAEADAKAKRRGMWASIVGEYEAMTGKSSGAETWLKMGDNLQAEHPQSAQVWYRKIIEEYPNSETAADARKRLGLPNVTAPAPALDDRLIREILKRTTMLVAINVPVDKPFGVAEPISEPKPPEPDAAAPSVAAVPPVVIPHTRSSKSRSSSDGSVHVRGYTRKDGSHVAPHSRSSPRRR